MSFSISQYREVRPASAEKLKDGRKRLTRYVSFKQNSEFPGEMGGTVGSTTDAATNFSSPPSGWENLYLVSAVTDASLSPNASGNNPVIVLTYEQAGTISQTDETRNNGALLMRTITSAHTAPSTPSGYTVIRTEDNNPNGFDTFTYTFAKGVGEIGRTIDYRQTSDQGTTGATVTTIRYIVADEGTVMPTSLSGSVEIGRDYVDQDGYRIWTTTWAKGTGLVSTIINTRTDGLRTVTHIALGTQSTPSGIVIDDQEREADGYQIHTVTAIIGADGTTPATSVSLAWERYVPFTYPGRAKAFTETYDTSKTQLALFTSPPVSTLVKATVTVTYTTTATLGTISDFWNPTDWAAVRKQWVGAYGVAAATVEALPGYRSTSATAVTLAGSGYDATIEGHNIYAGTTARITCTGGPADPGGNTYTLAAELEPAFTSTAGTVYYRKTLVSAAIPAQASLPV